ncbi:hypothetical protein WJ23_08260 [Burkholderia lata]|nr:hypothetical protein WJ23_08260 [Burkholderia lata]
MIGERGAKRNSAEWPARRRTQWMSGARPVAAPACAVGAQRFACPLAPLAGDVGKPLMPPGSALLTQTTPNASVF